MVAEEGASRPDVWVMGETPGGGTRFSGGVVFPEEAVLSVA
jgi:hypothetical protein